LRGEWTEKKVKGKTGLFGEKKSPERKRHEGKLGPEHELRKKKKKGRVYWGIFSDLLGEGSSRV